MSLSYKAEDVLQQTYDAVVVGSGATGGWAAKQLAEAGLKVALLEAGRAVSAKEFTEHMPAYKLKYRDHSPEIVRTRPIQKQCYACMEYNYEWFVNDLENPYSTPPDKPFTWQRLRVLGGRSLVWGRQSYRMSDNDFKAASRDGYGDDWPISYADLAPYYDIVEKYVGITGAAEGNEMLPDGQFLPPMKMSCGEILLRERVKAKFGYTVTIGRAAVLTQVHNGRAACHYCGPCERGCSTFSYFSSPFTTVKDAVKSGNCTLITNAVVSHVDMDNETNKARGVTYVDRLTRQVKEVRGKAVILCAQALESTRILLNSSTREYPNGLANSSGTLGRYLMDHVVGAGASGHLPDFKTAPNANEPKRPNGIYIPRFRNTPSGNKHSRFIRGYGYQGGAGAEFNFSAEGYGASLKKSVKEGVYGVALGAFGESLARWDNYIEIDSNLKDAWGIPALRISMTHGDNEAALMEDAGAAAAEMLEAAGTKDIRVRASMMAVTVRACAHLIERFRRSEM